MTHPTTKKSASKRVLIIFLGLLVIFVIPLLFAWYLYTTHPTSKSFVDKNGFLISPKVSFERLPIKNAWGVTLPHRQWRYKWVLLYVSVPPCEAECADMLAKMQMVSTGSELRYKTPVDAVVLTFNSADKEKLHDMIAYHYPSFVHAYIHLTDFKRVFSHAPFLREATFKGMLYIISPDGKISLGYTNQASANAMSTGLNALITQTKN